MAGKPKYQEVIQWVKDGIENGTLKYGDRLMSEKDLSRKFGLSRQTVRHATGELERQNLVTRVQGSGTYIGNIVRPAREKKFMNIAVLCTFYETYIFPPILRGIGDIMQKNGYSTQVLFTNNDCQIERMVLEDLIRKDNIDGLIVEPTQSALPNPNLEYYRQLLERHVPIISFNTNYQELNIPCVTMDDRKVGRKAAQLLIDHGHRRIGGIFKSDDGQGHMRYAGFIDAIMENHLELHEEDVFWIDTVMMRQLSKIEDYLYMRLKDCTGIVCYNDQVAVEIEKQALERGIRVPEELSLVGIDDANMAKMCRVPVTSFRHPKEELGRKVAENLLKMIDNAQFDGSYYYDPELVRRSSVADLKS